MRLLGALLLLLTMAPAVRGMKRAPRQAVRQPLVQASSASSAVDQQQTLVAAEDPRGWGGALRGKVTKWLDTKTGWHQKKYRFQITDQEGNPTEAIELIRHGETGDHAGAPELVFYANSQWMAGYNGKTYWSIHGVQSNVDSSAPPSQKSVVLGLCSDSLVQPFTDAVYPCVKNVQWLLDEQDVPVVRLNFPEPTEPIEITGGIFLDSALRRMKPNSKFEESAMHQPIPISNVLGEFATGAGVGGLAAAAGTVVIADVLGAGAGTGAVAVGVGGVLTATGVGAVAVGGVGGAMAMHQRMKNARDREFKPATKLWDKLSSHPLFSECDESNILTLVPKEGRDIGCPP